MSQGTVAILLRLLADRWIAYYQPFADPHAPILQGPLSQCDGQVRQDISFRSELAHLYNVYEQFLGSTAQPSDGALLVADLRIERLRHQYPSHVLNAYTAAQQASVRRCRCPFALLDHEGRNGRSFRVLYSPVRFPLRSCACRVRCLRTAVCSLMVRCGRCFAMCRCEWRRCAYTKEPGER